MQVRFGITGGGCLGGPKGPYGTSQTSASSAKSQEKLANLLETLNNTVQVSSFKDTGGHAFRAEVTFDGKPYNVVGHGDTMKATRRDGNIELRVAHGGGFAGGYEVTYSKNGEISARSRDSQIGDAAQQLIQTIRQQGSQFNSADLEI